MKAPMRTLGVRTSWVLRGISHLNVRIKSGGRQPPLPPRAFEAGSGKYLRGFKALQVKERSSAGLLNSAALREGGLVHYLTATAERSICNFARRGWYRLSGCSFHGCGQVQSIKGLGKLGAGWCHLHHCRPGKPIVDALHLQQYFNYWPWGWAASLSSAAVPSKLPVFRFFKLGANSTIIET